MLARYVIGTYEATTLDDLQKTFDISMEEAAAVLWEMGRAECSLHWDDDEDTFDPLGEVKLGDPDTTDDERGGDDCCTEWGPGGACCTRIEFHPGRHIAGDGDVVIAMWP